MFGRSYRRELEELKKLVENLRSGVPAEAATFHRHCQAITKAVEELTSRWYGSDTKQLEKLQLRAEKLASLAGGLTDLIRKGQKAAEQVSCLRERAAYSDEHAFIIGRCDHWMAIINKMGKDVEQDRHLQLDQKEIQEIENSVHDYVRTVDLLEQAEKLCRTLGPMDTALLKATLPKWKEDFRNAGPNAQKLAELESILEPLQRAPQPSVSVQPKTTEGLQPLRRTFADLRDWARVRGQDVPPQMQDAFRRATQEDALPSDIQALQQELSGELQRLRDAAQSERAEKLQQLRQDAGHYQRACGDTADLDLRLDRLINNPGDTPQNYEEWMNQSDDAEQYFSGIAQARQEALSAYLQTRTAAFEKRRQAMLKQPLTRVSRTETVSLGATIGQLSGVTGQMNIRLAHRTADSAEARLAKLERQAQEALDAFNGKRASLLASIAELKDSAMVFEKPEVAAACDDLDHRIESEMFAQKDLDEMNLRLTALHDTATSLIGAFLAQAKMLLNGNFEYCRDAHRATSMAVEALGKSLREPRFSRPEPHPLSPAEAGREHDTWKKLQQLYSERVLKLADQVEQAVGTGRAHLAKLLEDDGYLSPEQHHEGSEMLQQIEDPASLPPAAASSGLPRFAAMATLLERYKTFVRLTEGEREELQKLHEALKGRLRLFSEEDFKKVFPEAAERVSALIFGVNPEWPCGDMRRQLELAARCLDLAEGQARRLAADELERACAAAAVYLRSPRRRLAEQVRSTVEEIGEYAPSQLAPASIRRRLIQYISLPGGSDHA